MHKNEWNYVLTNVLKIEKCRNLKITNRIHVCTWNILSKSIKQNAFNELHKWNPGQN